MSAQNWSLKDFETNGGLQIGGAAANAVSWNQGHIYGGSQIAVNPVTGVIINCVKAATGSYGCEHLLIENAILGWTGLAAGQSIFAGSYLVGVTMHGGRTNAPAGAVLGPITYGGGGGKNNPTFIFRAVTLAGNQPMRGSTYTLTLQNAWDESTGTISSQQYSSQQ